MTHHQSLKKMPTPKLLDQLNYTLARITESLIERGIVQDGQLDYVQAVAGELETRGVRQTMVCIDVNTGGTKL